uniref:Replication factor A C-terminal domain-containing protein n=1 Tax=Triticum urartu TaxID=4572 RepID=A0A8R7JY84_TRIUA
MIQGSSSSATQLYLDLDIPEVQKYRTSYQWKCPTLQKHLPQVKQVSPLEVAGKLYTIEEISNLPTSSFQGGATFSIIAKVASIIPSVKWYYKACKRCGKGYNNMTDTPTCGCQFPVPCPMYKLPLTLTDNSGSLDATAFARAAEDLVERHADHVSMSMKIEAIDHVLTPDKAIGKEKLFYIGMNTDSSAKYPINYVLKKSFFVNNTESTPVPRAPKSGEDTTTNDNTLATHKPMSISIKENENRINAKRRIDFTESDADKSNSSKEPEESTTKKNKHENVDT